MASKLTDTARVKIKSNWIISFLLHHPLPKDPAARPEVRRLHGGLQRQDLQRQRSNVQRSGPQVLVKNVPLLKDRCQKSWQSDSGKLCKQVSCSSVESNGFDGRLKTKQTTARGRLKAEAWTIVPPTKQPQFIVWPQNFVATSRQIHYKRLKAQKLQKLP